MFETQEQSTYSLMPPSRQAKETHQTPAARQSTHHTASAAASTSSSSASAGRHGSDGGGSSGGTKKRQPKQSFHETLESLDASDDDICDDDDDLLDEAYGGGFDSNEYEAGDMLLDAPGGIDVDSLLKAGGGQHTTSTPSPRRPSSSSSSTTAAAFTQFTVRDFSSDDPNHRPLKRKRGRKSKEEKERELLQLASGKKDIAAPSSTATTGFVFEPPSAHFSPVSPSSSPTTAGGGFSVGTGLSGKDRRRKGRRSTLWTPEDDAKFMRAYRMVPFARTRLNYADVIIN